MCSGRSYSSLVVQEEKPRCKDRAGTWDTAAEVVAKMPGNPGEGRQAPGTGGKVVATKGHPHAFSSLPASCLVTSCRLSQSTR